MEITETTKAIIRVTDKEYRTIQTFCKWLYNNLCCDDVSSAIETFGEEGLLDFEGVTSTNDSIDIEILPVLDDDRTEIMNSVLEEIGGYGDVDLESRKVVDEFPQLYEDFKNMMIKVGYKVDKDL